MPITLRCYWANVKFIKENSKSLGGKLRDEFAKACLKNADKSLIAVQKFKRATPPKPNQGSAAGPIKFITKLTAISFEGLFLQPN